MKYVTEEQLLDIQKFLNEKYKERTPTILFQTEAFASGFDSEMSINDIVETKVESFQDRLFQMIREKQLDEVEMYKRGNISRQLFSKIKSEKDYHPTKNTVFSLAIGMKLNIDEASELLEKAGYSFSSANKGDLIIQYFLYHKSYNIFAINEVLDKYGFEVL